MKGELYVTTLLELEARGVPNAARPVIAELLGGLDAEEMLAELRKPATLSQLGGQLDRPAGEVFQHLAARIEAAMAPRERPSFALRHLKLLASYDSRSALADALDCAPADALAALVDGELLRRRLLAVGELVPPGELDVESLVLRLLRPGVTTRIEVHYGFGPSEWGDQLDVLLNPGAVALLNDTARSNGWGSLRPSETVAALVDLGPTASLDPTRTFDSLAMTELRRRVAGLVAILREESVRLAEEAAGHAPELAAVRRLEAWIQLYERGAARLGLKTLIAAGTAPLRELLPANAWTQLVVDGEPVATEPLGVRELDRYRDRVGLSLRRQELSTFEICVPLIGGGADPVAIVQAAKVPVDGYEHIRAVVGDLRGSDLSREGARLSERLLNTPVPTAGSLTGLLRGAFERHGVAFTRAVVLCGRTDPVRSVVAWREDLSARLPYAAPSGRADAQFPHDALAIAAALRRQYELRGERLDDVSG